MKLYGSEFSPYVRHCRVALAECGLEYEFVLTDYAQSAEQSPTARVPFLIDGALTLTDSASILRYIREHAGQAFLRDLIDYELFLLANTAMDTTINLFLLARDGLGPDTVPYLARQHARISAVLQALDAHLGNHPPPAQAPFTDGHIRVGCYLSWGLFREQIAMDDHPQLQRLLATLNAWPVFKTGDPRHAN
ncbi:MAG: glutathione S-transferase family protein [Pseudomonadota bacterium]